MTTGTLTERFLPALVEGNDAEAIRILTTDVLIDSPLWGRYTGIEEARRFVDDSIRWLTDHEAVLEAVRDTQQDDRTVSEWLLHIRKGEPERFDLPVAVVGEESVGGISAVRMYHSQWPLLGEHRHREPMLEPGDVAALPDVLREYQDALADGDVDRIMDTFEPGGCVREPAGGPYRYQGGKELEPFYRSLFSHGGGIVLEHCTVTDDGISAAIEYNAVRWGDRDIPREPGVAVYERGETGLLAAARIYDDVQPPGE